MDFRTTEIKKGVVDRLFNFESASKCRYALCYDFMKQMNGQPIATQRLPVAMETLDEPLYVNAKQYHRIIKRRQARAKLEAEGKIPKVRKVNCCFVAK